MYTSLLLPVGVRVNVVNLSLRSPYVTETEINVRNEVLPWARTEGTVHMLLGVLLPVSLLVVPFCSFSAVLHLFYTFW